MTLAAADPSSPAHSRRLSLMRACSHASLEEMSKAIESVGIDVNIEDVRAPESGLVMLRGRIGGTGDAFNVGEVTVTRAVVRLGNGVLGYSYLLGRAKARARLAAILDGACQSEACALALENLFIGPVLARAAEAQKARVEEAAATRVDFFTLVRGEDA